MLTFLIILIIVLIIFVKTYKKNGSFNQAKSHINKIDIKEDESIFYGEEDRNVTTVKRELTNNEIKYLSRNIRFLSSFFIAGSIIYLSVNLGRDICIKMFNITIQTWYISIFFILIGILTFFKSSTKKINGKILKIEGRAEIFTKTHIIHLGEYTVTLPKSWYIKDGKNVTIEGFESSPGNVIALKIRNYSVDASNLKKRGKWVMLSIFLFINLFISGVVYEGGSSLKKLLAIHKVKPDTGIIDSYDNLIKKSFSNGEYIELKNISSVVVHNIDQSYRVLLPNKKELKLDLSMLYYRLDKLKELQGTLMFNTLYYHDMDNMDFSFSNNFDSNNFILFMENSYFLNALDQWHAYLDSEQWVDMPVAEAYLNRFMRSQIDIIKKDLISAIDDSINKNNYIKLYPIKQDKSFLMKTDQLFIKYFNEPFKPEYNLEAYSYIKELENKLRQNEKVWINFFFKGYINGEQSTHYKVDIINSEKELQIIYYRAGIFIFSLLLYLFVVAVSIKIKQ